MIVQHFCLLRVVAAALLFALVGGCGFIKSEKSRVEDTVREGLKERTGKSVGKIELQSTGGGSYTGTAEVEGEVWDVKVTRDGNMVQWEAKERLTLPKVEKATRKLLAEQLGGEIQKFTITEQTAEKFTGTFTFNNLPYQYTSTVIGINVQVLFKPIMPPK